MAFGLGKHFDGLFWVCFFLLNYIFVYRYRYRRTSILDGLFQLKKVKSPDNGLKEKDGSV